jgi:hypothetical protein
MEYLEIRPSEEFFWIMARARMKNGRTPLEDVYDKY